jgi:phosphoenolpyruvate synthase/pyruvate phosphate dikinase
LRKHPMNPTLILKLSESADQPLSLVGGKAKNLMRLAGTGITVPPGFCITTEAYRGFVARNGLGPLIKEALETIPENDKAARLEAAKRIGEQFRNGIFPSELSDSIRSHFDGLAAASGGALRVAVRSSATAEDLAEASFAGVQKTVLNVRGFAHVLQALRECWASLWCEGVISYRPRMGLAVDDLAIAVIVQRMIPSQVSGVLFTVEPVTGDPGRLTVEACWGLGEALVSGNITPDHYELDRASFRVRKQIYGRQSHAIESSETGGTRLIPVPGSMRKRPCLAAEQLTELARTGLAIERHFGSPQDIEWAIDSPSGDSDPATIYFLQSRPITVLRPQSTGFAQTEPWDSPVPGAIWVRQSGGIVEHFSTPASPLFATAQLPLICELLDAQCPEMGVVTPQPTYALINGYFYNRSDYRLGPRALSLPVNYWRAARKGARHWRTHVLPKQSAALAAAAQFNLPELAHPSCSATCRHCSR